MRANFFSVLPLNNRSVNFSSGYLGMRLSSRVEAYQTGIFSAEFASTYGYQVPVLTIVYKVPEPTNLLFLGTVCSLFMVYLGRKRLI